MDYDVFISCKSEDYKYAEEIYAFLRGNDINTFLASTELRQMGESEYRRAITRAMKSAYHIIVFASNADYIDSTWVYYEWDMFLTAKLKGRKQGQILTILKDVEVDDINMDLWKYESLTFENYKERLLPYIETPASMQRKSEVKERDRLEAERRKIEEEKRLEKERKKNEFIALAEDYHQKMSALQSIEGKKMLHILKELGVTNRMCPVCNEIVPVSKPFCTICGWQFSPIHGIPELSYLVEPEDDQLSLAKELFAERADLQSKLQNLNESLKKAKYKVEELANLNENYLGTINATAEKNKELELENRKCKEAISRLEAKLREMTAERESLFMQIQKIKLEDAERLYKSGYNSYYGFNNSERNYSLAFSYLHQASLLSHRKAQALLAKCYYLGIGVKTDDVKGQYWESQSAISDKRIFSALNLPKSIVFEFKERKIFMVLSDDGNFYLGNISAKAEDLSWWWKNKWILTIGSETICAGAVLFAFAANLFKESDGLSSEQIKSGETGTITISSDELEEIGTCMVCDAINEQTGYKFGIPTEEELSGVSAKAQKTCIVLRLKDNPVLINDSDIQ